MPDVRDAEPLGITLSRAGVSVFGVVPGSFLDPAVGKLGDGSAVLSTGAAEALEVRVGDSVRVDGLSLRVAAVAGDDSFSHTPVLWTSLADYQRLAPGSAATVVALRTDGSFAAADGPPGTTVLTRHDARAAIGSFAAENGSLQLMRGLLFAISALVIGAFFTVWTIQRSGDIAVLKALGAGTWYLLRDALGQALVLLVAGTAVGAGLAAVVGRLAAGSVPLVLDAGTVLLPAGVLVALGAIGAALSVRRITSVDPLTALGSAR